jgi:hypothetical protein
MEFETKSVGASRNLSLAPDSRDWDSDAAVKRIRTKTDSKDTPSASYKKYFFWYDADDKDNFGAYKMPFADVVDGEIKAVPSAVNAAYAAMKGARGGVNIPSGDRSSVLSAINSYRKKMGVGEHDDDSDKNITLEMIHKVDDMIHRVKCY